MKKKKKSRPQNTTKNYYEKVRLFRIVDGAVANAFSKHPEYLNEKIKEPVVRLSIVKRVAGAVVGAGSTIRYNRAVAERKSHDRTYRQKRPHRGSAKAASVALTEQEGRVIYNQIDERWEIE